MAELAGKLSNTLCVFLCHFNLAEIPVCKGGDESWSLQSKTNFA